MLKKTLHTFLCAAATLISFTSCEDDFPVGDYVIGEGEAMVSAEIIFQPLVATEVNTGSRTDGNVLNDLNDITVFVYSEQSNLFAIYSGDDLKDLKVTQKDTEGANTDMPEDAGEKAEDTTATASFSLGGLPYGRYYIYVTANIDFGKSKQDLMSEFARLEDLKKYTVKWSESDIAANDQMFGYFTAEEEDTGAYADNANLVVINKKMVNLHAWINRCASKVTIVFDGKGLKEDVWVYVQNVSIKSIPRFCKIGEENGVYTVEGGGENGLGGDSLIVNGEKLYYNTDGLTDANPGNDYTKWLQISKGSGLKGAVTVDNETKETTTHSEYDKALYFYENMQGNYEGSADKAKYDKKQNWNNVGIIPAPGQDDYKDNVPFGTYIEVEAYYVSQNPENITNGRIIYRFMLGQDADYDYNAKRNHHYKVTLGFNGWANQPDWHVVYVEDAPTIFTNPTYYVSYSYNTKSYFPIRILGNPTGLEVEIVENNWAPYDPSQPDNVPPQVISTQVKGEMDFQWNKTVYQSSTYYYGLNTPYNNDGSKQESYKPEQIAMGAPQKVTGIWAGFLALQVPGNTPEDIGAILMSNANYSRDYGALKNYFYGEDYKAIDENTKKEIYSATGPGMKQNYREFSNNDLNNFSTGQRIKTIGSGNNACEITKADDGSITINLPMWTRPKSMLGISGFSGNNPYDTYQRKAMVRVTAKYVVDGKTKTITRYRPVYQVERVVNPKAVWRAEGDNESFKVELMRRDGAISTEFSTFKSEGAWRAKIKTVSPGAEGFISLSGGNVASSEGYVRGATGTPIDFNINFNGMGQSGKSLCAIVEVEYHGYTCKHSIYVRQGFNEPLELVNVGAKWSSYSLFKTEDKVAFGTQWNASQKNYIPAELTKSPLALGTMFKRGNYNGILVKNNNRENLGPRKAPGVSTTFEMSDGDNLDWAHIQGYPLSDSYTGYSGTLYKSGTPQHDFIWGRFSVKIGNEERHYRVPDYNDYNDLMSNGCEFGIGVLYDTKSTQTATSIEQAYGFLDVDNDGKDDNTGATNIGIRGILVYNPTNAHQLFFPIGFRGIGRRTIVGFNKDSYDDFGTLRYGAVDEVLSQSQNKVNQYRPIPYNLPASPGAIYWISEVYEDAYLGWDMNYFDLNFNQFDYAMSRSGDYSNCKDLPDNATTRKNWSKTHGGDAVPIKLVLDDGTK